MHFLVYDIVEQGHSSSVADTVWTGGEDMKTALYGTCVADRE